MFITIAEIIDIVIMTIAVGFIFSKIFKKKKHYSDPIKYYMNQTSIWNDLKYGIMIAAPAVVFHELAHKIVAMSFGAQAVLHAPITLYAIAIILLLANFPIIFFIGGYVTVTGILTSSQLAMIAIAGPLVNLIIWAVIKLSLDKNWIKKNRYDLGLMAKLNLFLFAFNMIPIPGFDGFNFFRNLIRMFF